MKSVLPQIQSLTDAHPSAPSMAKSDGTPVTALDLALSELLEVVSLKNFEGTTVYSEEKFSDLSFPLIAIDPLDGTREYIKKRPEWAISMGHFETQTFDGEGWVYNPMTKELYDSDQLSVPFVEKSSYYGEVSHSEWDRGWYKDLRSKTFEVWPMGSIAYKLGRLSAGRTDFVVSLAPKSIWDIAGGSLLCKRSKIKFYSQGKEVTKVQHLYLPPLIWCPEELYPQLAELFPQTDKRL